MKQLIQPHFSSRRNFFHRIVDGMQGTALASLLGTDLYAVDPLLAASHDPQAYDLSPKKPHFEPKAKAVIQLFMNGGPKLICSTPSRCSRSMRGQFQRVIY